MNSQSSDDGEEVTPVPIPNTEVKLFSADGSWGSPPVRVGRRWATEKKVIPSGVAFFVCEKVDIIFFSAVCLLADGCVFLAILV